MIFPIGTKFVVMGYTDNKEIQTVSIQDQADARSSTEVETQVAIPRHIIKLKEVDPSLYQIVF